MAKYLQDSTDIKVNEVSGTSNINLTLTPTFLAKVGGPLSIQTEEIDCGTFEGSGEKFNQTYTVTIPSGYTCLGIVGWYLSGGGFTNLFINEIYYENNIIHWALKNSLNSSTAQITLYVKLLLVKNI